MYLVFPVIVIQYSLQCLSRAQLWTELKGKHCQNHCDFDYDRKNYIQSQSLSNFKIRCDFFSNFVPCGLLTISEPQQQHTEFLLVHCSSGMAAAARDCQSSQWVVSSTLQIVKILVHSHFDLVSSLSALGATEPVSEPVTQMALELINNHLISVQQKR